MAWALVADVEGYDVSSGVTTGNIDTTGANFLVAFIADVGGTCPISDSKSNTWTALTSWAGGGGGCRLHYVASPTVGAGHNFTASGSGQYPILFVAAFSGGAASPFDKESGIGAGSGTSAQPGSLTPAETAELFVCGIGSIQASHSINSSFVETGDLPYLGGGAPYAGAFAYKIKTDATAENPTWTYGTSDLPAVAMACFKPSGGASPASLPPTPSFRRFQPLIVR